jgi:hypothetical protein
VTGDELRQAVRDLVGVPSAATYPRLTDANINSYVNTAMHRLAVKAEPLALQATDTISISASDATYELTAVALRIFTAHVVGVGTLSAISYPELERDYPTWRTSSGTTTHYIIEGLNTSGYIKLRLWPTPASAISSGLEVRYLAEPTSISGISSAEILQWPEYVQDGFACYAAHRTIIRFSERGIADPRAQAILGEWNEAASLFIDQEQSNAPQRWGTTALDPSYFNFGWESPI